MLSFGERLRVRLRAAGKTPSDLAQLTGASLPLIHKWLNAENVELTTLYRIAKGMNWSIESLVEGIDADYDAMRQLEQEFAQAPELLARIAEPQRGSLWRLIRQLAGAPESEPQ
jgi:transcriptional regulator with XRE-family HTH domain